MKIKTVKDLREFIDGFDGDVKIFVMYTDEEQDADYGDYATDIYIDEDGDLVIEHVGEVE